MKTSTGFRSATLAALNCSPLDNFALQASCYRNPNSHLFFAEATVLGCPESVLSNKSIVKIPMKEYPERYWHCYAKLRGSKDRDYAIDNDLTYAELKTRILDPWHAGKQFVVNGKVIRNDLTVEEIKVTQTTDSQKTLAQRHDAEMSAAGFGDLATDRKRIPIRKGVDYTQELLFEEASVVIMEEGQDIVETICKRLSYSARILANRSRKDKQPFVIEDEYDVQDLLQALLRGYLKYSVQEDPMQKRAGVRSSRADVSIEDLGIIIEVKFVSAPSDQKRIFDEFAQDVELYSTWASLKKLIYLIYNSGDLRDPESFERLSGRRENNGRKFSVKIILA